MTTILIVDKCGQLGNRLFLFAHFIAHAIENGHRIVNPAFDEYSPHFCLTEPDLFCRFPPRTSRLRPTAPRRARLHDLCARWTYRLVGRLPRSRGHEILSIDVEEAFDLSDPNFVRLAQSKSLVVVRGYQFRDHAAIEKHASAVRGLFQPVDSIVHGVDNVIEEARSGTEMLVGVHIRRGDYKEFLGGAFYFEVAYYAEAMRRVQEITGCPMRFLVCSNEEIDEAAFLGLDVRRGSGHLVEDMYALARCDLLLGPPSSFSSWAAFHGEAPLFRLTADRLPSSLEDFGPNWSV